MSLTRVGVIGVGMMGERHCRVYSNLRQVQLVGISDLDKDRGEKIASTYNTQYFADYQQLLAEVDAVTIATTTPTHFELASEALESRVHILVEKPLAETIEQGKKLVNEAKRKKLTLQVGHIERFNPAYQELKNVIEGMCLVAVNIRRLSPFDTSNTDVDVIWDLMIHDLDLITDLIGRDSDRLNAVGRATFTDAIDYAVANFSFNTGPVATLFASRITEQKIRLIEVVAEGAYIEADLLGKNLLIHRRTFNQFTDAKYRQESIIERIHVPMIEPLLLELQHFIECVSERKPVLVSGNDGLHAMMLAQTVSDLINDTVDKPYAK